MTEAAATIAWKAFNRARKRYDRRMQSEVQKALDAQFSPIIAAFEDGRKDVENLATSYHIEKVFQLIYQTVGTEFARMAYIGQKNARADFFTKDRGSDADMLEGFWKRTMKRIVDTQAGEKIKGITQTTKDWVKRAIEQVQEEGLSIPNAAKLLREKWKLISKHRATVIARSEIVSSSNAGSLAGAKSTGLQLEKSWLATRDSRTRSSHIHVDGQTVGLDASFVVNGHEMEYPGDSRTAPPSETVQCRCSLVFKRKT